MAIKRQPADIEFSKALRLSRGNRCEYCGTSDGQIECCHIYGRRHKATRWSLDNCVSLCHHHHRHFTENPISFHDWLHRHLGHGHMDILREKHNQTLKVNKDYRKEVAAHYRAQIKKVENGEIEPERIENYQ